MAEIYNQIGSLTELLSRLNERGIDEFQTLDDIRSFRDNYKKLVSQVRENSGELLKQDIVDLESAYKKLSLELNQKVKERKELLKNEVAELTPRINNLSKPNNLIEKLTFWFRKKRLSKRKFILESHFDKEVNKPFRALINKADSLKLKLEDKKTNKEKWINSLSKKEIDRLEFILSVFVENKPLFYGAEGEERVEKELSKLPDTYSVINDYKRQFHKPIYDRKNDDRIHSIQIDHIVVGPTGVYLIETKNWSKDSIQNRDLFSPVKQLRRFSFAMFVLLNQAVKSGELKTFTRDWGERKISPKNIILLMKHKPSEVFQFVNILSLPEINNYITHGSPIFESEELEELINYLNYE